MKKIFTIDTQPEYEIDEFGSKFPKYEKKEEEEDKHEAPNKRGPGRPYKFIPHNDKERYLSKDEQIEMNRISNLIADDVAITPLSLIHI